MDFRSNPKVYDFSLAPGEGRTLTFDPVAAYTHVQVTAAVTVLLNGSTDAALQLDGDSGPLVFHHGDLPLRSLSFENKADAPAEVLVITNEVPN